MFSASGQLQIILGTGTVNKVYDEFIAISGLTAATKEEVKAAAAAKQNIFKRAIKCLGDIFVPIIPAIVASGFLMGIMEALNFMVNNGFLNLDTPGSIYVFANLFANKAYVFLPILIAYSAEKAFGGNAHHAVGVTSPDGMELLIHVGVDTVAMNGDGFTCFVQEGQQVKAGDKLIAFDRAKIAAASHPDVVVVLVTNSDDYESLTIQTGGCGVLDKVIQV